MIPGTNDWLILWLTLVVYLSSSSSKFRVHINCWSSRFWYIPTIITCFSRFLAKMQPHYTLQISCLPHSMRYQQHQPIREPNNKWKGSQSQEGSNWFKQRRQSKWTQRQSQKSVPVHSITMSPELTKTKCRLKLLGISGQLSFSIKRYNRLRFRLKDKT